MNWRIGFRLVRGNGRAGIIRSCLLVGGMAVGTFFLILALVFPQVVKAREHRAGARQPTAQAAGPRMGYAAPFTRRIGSHLINGYFVAPSSNAVPPPGLTRFAPVGEAEVSPALAAELHQDPGFRAIFPYTSAGLISTPGLVAPDELFAWVTVDADQLKNRIPFRGYGVHVPFLSDVAPGAVPLLEGAFIGLVGLPLAVYFVVCARLSAATRNRRLAALRLVGMSARETARVNAVEASVVAAVGGAIGLGTYIELRGSLASRGAGGFRWFPADGALSALESLFLVLAVVILATAVARIGARRAIRQALSVRRQAPVRSTSPLQLLPLVAGLGLMAPLLLLASHMRQGSTFSGRLQLAMLISLGLTGLGCTLSVPFLAGRLAARIADRSSRVWLQLGARRLEFDPGTAARVVAGLVIVVFGSGFAAGLLRDAQASTLPLGRYEQYSLTADEVPASARSQVLGISSVRGAAVQMSSAVNPAGPGQPPGPNSVPVVTVFATCRTMVSFVEHPLPNCLEGTPYRLNLAGGPPPLFPIKAGRRLSYSLDYSPHPRMLELTVPGSTLTIPSEGPLVADLLFPPDRLEGRVPDSATIYLVSNRTDAAINDVSEAVARLAPGAELIYENDDLAKRLQGDLFAGMLKTAVALGLIVGLVAFALAAIDAVVERRAHLTALRIAGVPRPTLRRAQAAQSALLLSVGILLALIGAKLAEQLTVAAGGFDRSWTWGDLAWGGGVALLSLAVAASTAPGVARRIDVSLIRRE